MTIRIFRHYVPLPLFLLALLEAAIFVGAVYFATNLRFMGAEAQLYAPNGEPISLLPRAIVYALVMAGAMTAFGMYGADFRKGDRNTRVRFLGAFVVGMILMMIVFYAIPQSRLGRGIMALTFVLSLAGSGLVRALFLHLLGNTALKRRVLVLGSGSRAAEVDVLARRLGEHAGFQAIGFVRCKNEKPAVDETRLIHREGSLLVLARKYQADEIVAGVRDRRNGHLSMPELLECKLAGIHVIDLPSFFERETGYVRLDSLNASWMVFSEGFLKNTVRKAIKRLFDIVVSSGLLVLTFPLMALAALAILLETGRPILYRQDRVGEEGRVFSILKFRSMRTDAEKDGVARWARKNDNRVTLVGRFLRVTRIDELPQLVNVLRGDMSFVGPRPERPPFVSDLSRQVPYYGSRHSVKPGITGWAQINYPYGASVEDSVRKLQFDLYYVKNHSLFLDFVILLGTAQVVLFGRGAR